MLRLCPHRSKIENGTKGTKFEGSATGFHDVGSERVFPDFQRMVDQLGKESNALSAALFVDRTIPLHTGANDHSHVTTIPPSAVPPLPQVRLSASSLSFSG